VIGEASTFPSSPCKIPAFKLPSTISARPGFQDYAGQRLQQLQRFHLCFFETIEANVSSCRSRPHRSIPLNCSIITAAFKKPPWFFRLQFYRFVLFPVNLPGRTHPAFYAFHNQAGPFFSIVTSGELTPTSKVKVPSVQEGTIDRFFSTRGPFVAWMTAPS